MKRWMISCFMMVCALMNAAHADEPATKGIFEGETLYVDPTTQAATFLAKIRKANPDGKESQEFVRAFNRAARPNRQEASLRSKTYYRDLEMATTLLDIIVQVPQVRWFGDWTQDIKTEVDEYVTRVLDAGCLPVFVLYNIPNRDAGHFSRGGLGNATAYTEWIDLVIAGLKGRKAVILLEPDSVAHFDQLEGGEVAMRFTLLKIAVERLKANPKAKVYIDAGNPHWHAPEVIAPQLKDAGIAIADGFCINVSNFCTDQECVEYGEKVSKLVGDKHFVADRSRNGNGALAKTDATGEPVLEDGKPVYLWCNPPGRALGFNPTTKTKHELVDLWLWVKPPGESDGEGDDGKDPKAGEFTPRFALEMADNAVKNHKKRVLSDDE